MYIYNNNKNNYPFNSPTLKDYHWLPIKQRIVFKLCLLMHQVHTGRAPSYLRSCGTASLLVVVCAAPVVNDTNGSARV